MTRGDYSYSQDSLPDICLLSTAVNFRYPLSYFAVSLSRKKIELNILGYFGVYNTAFLRRLKTSTFTFLLL